MPNTQAAPALEDGWWYWVRYDIGFGADAIEAPARYRAQIDCFYSHQFSGIPARECEVLGPALRSPPADLTFDALLKRIKASPFRDDMATANLIVSQAEQIKALSSVLKRARGFVHANLRAFLECHTDPVTKLITDRDALIEAEVDQDLLNAIDEAIERAGSHAQ